MNRIRIALLAVLLGTLTGLGPAPAHADPPSDGYCATPESLNCTMLVENRLRGGYFCQRIGERAPRCEVYWPFRNPIANAHSALDDPDAFPADYLPTKQRAAALERRLPVLQERLDRKNDRIAILRKRLARLN